MGEFHINIHQLSIVISLNEVGDTWWKMPYNRINLGNGLPAMWLEWWCNAMLLWGHLIPICIMMAHYGLNVLWIFIRKLFQSRTIPTNELHPFITSAMWPLLSPCTIINPISPTYSAPLNYMGCVWWISLIVRFIGPTWGQPGSCRPQVGPM